MEEEEAFNTYIGELVEEKVQESSTQVQTNILSEVTGALHSVLVEGGVLRTGDLESVRQNVLKEVGGLLQGVLRDAGVLRAVDLLDVRRSLREEVAATRQAEYNDLAAEVKGLRSRVKDLETGRIAMGQGLRMKVETFTARVLCFESRMKDLEENLDTLGDEVFGRPSCTEEEEEEGGFSDNDSEVAKRELAIFRKHLAVGMPVHLEASGIGILKEHGKAGFLQERTASGWKVLVGSSVVTVGLENIVP